MANKKMRNKRNMTRKRIEEIENYLLSINGLVNPNTKEVTLRNPIVVNSTILILKELNNEMNSYDFDIKNVDLERIFGNESVSEVDELIKWLGDGMIYCIYNSAYKEMLKGEQLEKSYPAHKRQERIKELEVEIQRSLQVIDMLNDINPSLAKNKAKEIELLEKEMKSLKETLYIPTREELSSKVYSAVNCRLDNYKTQCRNKLEYLERIL